MTDNSRWLKAQEYELNWWKKRHKIIDLNYLEIFAEDLQKDLNKYMVLNQKSRILEIGCGPAGILTHLPGEYRAAIDPLENFYSTIPEYINYRDKNVRYFCTKGEELPFEDNSFNLVIIDNVLDHCENPEKVISEINRVLAINGIIYFKQNVYHFLGKFIRNTLELIEFDKGHPFNFSATDIFNLFENYNYKILSEKRRGHFKQLIVELKMKNVKAFIRMFTFMTRDKISLIIQKL